MATITIAQARTTFDQQLNDTDPEVTDAIFIQWANFIDLRLYRVLYRLDAERYMWETTVSQVSWTASYALDASFLTIDTLNAWLYDTDSSGALNIDQPLTRRPKWSQTRWYYIDRQNDKVVLVPTPTTTATLILRYIPAITKYTATSDVMLLTDEFWETLNAAFVSLYAAWKLDKNNAFYDENFLASLEELYDNFRSEAYTLNIDDVSSFYR